MRNSASVQNILPLLLACAGAGLSACGGDGPGLGERVGDDDAWYLTVGGEATDEAWGVAPAPDGSGDVFLATHLGAPVLTDAFTWRLDAAGGEIWRSQWGGTYSEQAFMLLPAGDALYLSGLSFHGVGPTDADAMVLAMDMDDGSPRWDWVHDGGHGWDEVDGLGVDGDGLWLSGWTAGATSSEDMLIGQLSTEGEERWLTSWGTDGWDEGNGHLVLTDEALVVAGLTGGVAALVGGDMTVAAFDRDDGALQWSQSFGESLSLEDGLGMTGDEDGLYVVGYAPGASGTALTVWGLSPTGALRWTTQAPTTTWSGGRAIATDPGDGSLVVAANVQDPTEEGVDQGTDILLLRLDPEDGAILAQARWGGAGEDVAHEVAVQDGVVFVAGETDSAGAGGLDGLLLRVDGDTLTMPPQP